MPRYALINPTNQIDRYDSNVKPNVETKAGWRWLPADPGVRPNYDPETQAVVGPNVTVGASAVTESYSVRALTAQELTDRKDARVSNLSEVTLLKVILNLHNRIRTLEGQGAHTLTQLKTALQGLV